MRELENALERWLIGAAPAETKPCEAERIARMLDATGGNVARAARRLGLPRSTLRGYIARLDLSAHLARD